MYILVLTFILEGADFSFDDYLEFFDDYPPNFDDYRGGWRAPFFPLMIISDSLMIIGRLLMIILRILMIIGGWKGLDFSFDDYFR